MSKLRLIVLGIMGRCPFGGQTWLYLNWLSGLARCGHEVWYVEDDVVWPYDPIRNAITGDCSYAVKHVSKVLAKIGLEHRWAFRFTPLRRPRSGKPSVGGCWGMSDKALDGLYQSCDALLNIVGATKLREPQLASRRRVYIETDPVVAQLRLARGHRTTREIFDDHHAFITYGENYGNPDCGVPTCGIPFKKTRQPIDLDLWPMVYDKSARCFTTIGNYRQQGYDVRYKGKVYHWSKHHEWEKILDLPGRTAQEFELAMQCKPRDRAKLEKHGWRIVPPLEMSLDIFGKYPEYFRRSRAELTVAKDQNIRLRSGWFSERDACYLACGKPVIAQDTGFSNILPTGEGLFSFRTMEEALNAIERINSDYHKNCRAARAIAKEYFEAKKVAKNMLVEAGLG